MKLLVFYYAVLLGLVASAVSTAHKQSAPIPMVIQARCEMCAEPFFVPTFRFTVVEGTWPEKGILRCTMNNTPVMECENGLKLKVARITFNSGRE